MYVYIIVEEKYFSHTNQTANYIRKIFKSKSKAEKEKTRLENTTLKPIGGTISFEILKRKIEDIVDKK